MTLPTFKDLCALAAIAAFGTAVVLWAEILTGAGQWVG